MNIRWSAEARDDVDRLADFVAAFDPIRAGELEQELSEAPKRLLQFARRGSRLSDFEPREVREFRVGHYVMRYELTHANIAVLRFFHARDNRY